MSKTMAIHQLEQQIEALPPVEQVMMLERIIRQLKQLLLAQSNIATPRIESKELVKKLNSVYKVETSRMDAQLSKAQFASIGRDEWL